MAIEPTEANISQVTEFSGCTRDVAIRFLKIKNNDPNAALIAIIEGEDLSKAEQEVTWDDSAWGADREGAPAHGPQAPAAYNEASLHPLGASAAPTRGPSPAPSARQPTSKSQEDEDMEKALAMSRQDLGYEGQETGVVASDGQQTTNYYDPSKWAMTVSRPRDAIQSKEIIPDLDPNERRHIGDEPRFLMPLAFGDYLSNLLTIAHAIPLARETLLSRSFSPYSYGHDLDWWRGHEIKLPKIVHTSDGTPAEPTNGDDDEIVAEMQRLMAFLDSSTRAYASVDALAKFVRTKDRDPTSISESLLDHALYAWESAAKNLAGPEALNVDIFHSIAGTNGPEGMTSPNAWSLPMTASVDYQQSDDTVTLEEVMDNTLWDTDPDDEAFCDTYLERAADILPFRISQDVPGKDKLGLVAPSTMYVDKYLQENVAATRPIRREMAQVKQRMRKLSDVQKKLKTFKHPTKGDNLDASQLIEFARGHFSGANRARVLEERESRGIDLSGQVPEPPPEYAAIAQRLDRVYESIKSKLEELEREKIKAREVLTKLSHATPSDLSTTLKHRYHLRGVATKPNVTYVLRPITQHAVQREDTAMFTDSDAPPGMQWWRIEYDVNSSNTRILKTPSTEDDVLRAVELEHTQALLVYASDRAISFESNSNLPHGLSRFIETDNDQFTQELEYHQDLAPKRWTSPMNSRRQSISSTTAQFDEGMHDDLPPAYDYGNHSGTFADDKAPLIDPSQMSGVEAGYESPPAHEIRLDDEENIEPDHEMVDTGAGFFKPTEERRRSDSTMIDVQREFD